MNHDSSSKPIFLSPYHRLLFLAGTLLLLGWAGWVGFRDAGFWISRSDGPEKVEVVICLGGHTERIQKAAELYQQGYSRNMIVTVNKTKDELTKLKVPAAAITLVPWPETTYQEALAVAPIQYQTGYSTALVVTDSFHIERVRWTFNHVFRNEKVHFRYISSDFPFHREGWWQDKLSRFYVLSEVSKMAYYWLVHGGLGIDLEPPWLIAFKHRYINRLQAWCL
jgi:uncharacterized SAM-binding protein YcdF (DUF218 family)